MSLVQKLWLDQLAQGAQVNCVWSGRRVTSREHLAIDHVIPYSLWGNNDLWNLLPAFEKVNAQKSDAVPAPALITARRDAILAGWRVTRAAHPAVFDRDVALSLGTAGGTDWEIAGIDALARKCRYLIDERGYPAWQPT